MKVMVETATFLKNRWYVAALTTEVGDMPLARTIAGQKAVLFRDTKGEIIALQDRCAHRQAPLSLGEVGGDNIQCGYHGLTFDRSGECSGAKPETDPARRLCPPLSSRRKAELRSSVDGGSGAHKRRDTL